jgi:putative glutamine amidotransferase
MSRRPLIGITPTPSTSTFDHGTFYRYCLADTYVGSVWRAGGNPVILPWVPDMPIDVLDEIDGLIISGGGDVDPVHFNQDPHDRTYGIDELRDAYEIALMRDAARRDLPTLAICRGIQVMSVAFGGVLHQHVPDVTDGSIEHRQHDAGYTQHDASHRVTLENTPNPLSDLLDASDLMVNSFHHQVLADVPEPLRIAGRAEDGSIEAIWHPGMRFGIGVQWHPEMLAASHPGHARFFEALVQAAQVKAPAIP